MVKGQNRRFGRTTTSRLTKMVWQKPMPGTGKVWRLGEQGCIMVSLPLRRPITEEIVHLWGGDLLGLDPAQGPPFVWPIIPDDAVKEEMQQGVEQTIGTSVSGITFRQKRAC